jgi:hypothetical protein
VKRRNHMIPCAIVAVIAVVLLATGGGSPLGAGFGFALLLCPLMMGGMMWLLMRQQPTTPTSHCEHQHAELPAEPAPESKSPRP